ncbi:MAG: flagellar hook-length control protein FliK [Woeseiaceae bacterium]|nr:flagellar hook-length control protein FliK [Woeseiaceae bacterium]
MTPTFTLPSNTTVNPLQGSASKLLPGEATEPVAAFSNAMKVFREPLVSPPESGEWMPADGSGEAVEWPVDASDILARGGEWPPFDGKELPVDLQAVMDELRNLLASGETLPGASNLLPEDASSLPTTPETDVALNAGLPIDLPVEVDLPPGLTFETEISTLPPSIVPLNAPELSKAPDTILAATAPRVGAEAAAAPSDSAAGLLQSGPGADRQALIERLSALVNVPAEKIESFAEQRDIRTADLQRLTDFLDGKQRSAEQAIAVATRTESLSAAATPVPAPMARIDGTILDGKSQRLRPIGVGQPQPSSEARLSPTVVDLDVTMTDPQRVNQPRPDVIASELLRQESMLNFKPSPGGFQVAAPQQSAANVATNQAFQPLDAGSKPLPGSIDVPVREAAWGDRLNERVVMMANNRLQNVDLRLSPAELGPLRVKVSVEDGTANVSFVAQHAITRDAIEQALPRLKLLLEQNGIDLGNTSVDQQAPDQGAPDGDGAEPSRPEDIMEARATGRRGDEPDVTSDPRQAVRLSRGLLDTFA